MPKDNNGAHHDAGNSPGQGRSGQFNGEVHREATSLFQITGDKFYTTTFTGLNGSGVTGEAIIGYDVSTSTITVAISASGLEADEVHLQHIHGFPDGIDAETPDQSFDADQDGFVELAEGLPSYGPVLLNLSTDHENGSGADNGHSHGDVSGFPTAPDGSIWFVESYQLPAELLSSDPMLDLREIVIHGMSVGAAAGAGTPGEVDGTGGYKLLLPVASGELSEVGQGDQFDVVELGTSGRDVVDRTGEQENYYINTGMGNDRLTGGDGDDFFVGGAGRDRLYGRQGNDSFIGGGGDDAVFGGNGDDIAIINTATDGSDMVDLGRGWDTVNVGALAAAGQIRLTFTSAEVGNNSGSDSGTLANQDGGLAVRLQAEDGLGSLGGAISRLDDEGVRFVSTTPGVTFDVRDLVSGVARGDQFDVVELGTSGRDVVDKRGADIAYYINAGMGDDRLTGGESNDFLVGGIGKDRLYGEGGNDSLIGGMGEDAFVFSSNPGNDTILDFVSGTDKIVLTSFDIDFGDVRSTTAGANTILDIDADADGTYDSQVTLMNTAAPQESDFVFL
jgi:Ca2+-binding RTX toxin-like protein